MIGASPICFRDMELHIVNYWATNKARDLKGSKGRERLPSALAGTAATGRRGMAAVGHEDQLAPPGLSGRHRFGQATFTGTHGNERDAPKAAIRARGSHERVEPKGLLA